MPVHISFCLSVCLPHLFYALCNKSSWSENLYMQQEIKCATIFTLSMHFMMLADGLQCKEYNIITLCIQSNLQWNNSR
jgi:hypothetical protein